MMRNGVFKFVMTAVLALVFAGCETEVSDSVGNSGETTAGVSLDHASLIVAAGVDVQLIATVTGTEGNGLTWSSSNAAIAVVVDGLVTGVAAGSATISAVLNGGWTAVCAVTVIPQVAGLHVAKQPDKQTYFIGEEVDLAGLVVYASFDGSSYSSQVTIAKNHLDKSKFVEDDAQGVPVPITIAYGGQSVSIGQMTVRYKITGVSVTNIGEERFAKEVGGETTFTAKVAVEKGSSLPIDVTAVVWSIVEAGADSPMWTASGSTINKDGTLTVAVDEELETLTVRAVSPYDKTIEGGTATVYVNVPIYVAITTTPVKNVYFIGDPMDVTGLAVTATYSDLSERLVPIAAANITGFATAAAVENKTVTVTCMGRTATFLISVRYKIINVSVNPPTMYFADGEGGSTPLAAIVAVEQGPEPPTDVTAVIWSIVTEGVAEGTAIDENTGALTVAADEALETLTVRAVSTYYNAEASGEATVNIATPASIEVTIDPDDTAYYIGEEINKEHLVVTAVYSPALYDGTTGRVLDETAYTLSPTGAFAEADAGTRTITVTSDDLEAAFAVTVRYKITNVSVSSNDGATSVNPGGSLTFTAAVAVEGEESLTSIEANGVKAVTWSIVTEGVAEGTAIDDAGVLTVAADETAPTLTIKALSTYDNTTYGEIAVTAHPPLL
jgi:hypothetical protein